MTKNLADLLGDVCPECGWTRNAHRPPLTVPEPVPACSRYTPGAEYPAPQPEAR